MPPILANILSLVKKKKRIAVERSEEWMKGRREKEKNAKLGYKR